MAKFPSQRKLQYAHAAAVSNDGWTTFTTRNAADDGTAAGVLNLPKDLSILNRRGYSSTSRKGVPLVYRCKIDLYLQDEDGFGVNNAVGSDFCTTLKIDGCQNNWVMKNAAVKFHAARRAMWRKAGVKSRHLGAYADTIRYNYDTNGNTWIQPTDGDGNPFLGGTWDTTELVTESDSSGFYLKLVGLGIDEANDNVATAINIAHSYLQSRAHVPADSNLESSVSPLVYSVLNELLRPVATSNVDDEIISDAQDQGDNPPYEVDLDNVNSDITEPVELGRAIAGIGNSFGSVIVDIPFGLASLRLTHYDAVDTAITTSPCIALEVLDIFEMQG